MCLAVPGELLKITNEDPLTRAGRVSFGGVIKEVNLAYVPEAKPGDFVVVHVGFALSIVDPEDAQLIFEFLREEDALDELKEVGE